jgi:hypothetical protein
MEKTMPKTRLTPRFAEALRYAIDAHDGQVRKGTDTTYVAHLLGVASLVLEHGSSEDEAIAGLLHDTIEDGGAHHEAPIRLRFGGDVGMSSASQPRRRAWSARGSVGGSGRGAGPRVDRRAMGTRQSTAGFSARWPSG